MKSSMLLAASGALLAMASPVEKRAYETEIVTEWTTVYVTEGQTATMYGPGAHEFPTTSTSSTPTPEPSPPAPTSTAPPPPPEPVVVHETQPPPAAVVYPTTSSKKPAPTTTKTAQQGAAPSDYAGVVLQHHNAHRSNHSSPAMTYSNTHANYAAQSAAKCKFEHDMTPGGGGYGQNIAMWASSANAKALGANKATSRAISDAWYNGELNDFSSQYGKTDPDSSTFHSWGHFTQIVWSGSTQVGCHAQFCPAGTMYPNMDAWFTVCNYYPAGNMGGAYAKNVHRPEGQPSLRG